MQAANNSQQRFGTLAPLVVMSACGVLIIVSGLWLLSGSSGPYHPAQPVAQGDTPFYDGS